MTVFYTETQRRAGGFEEGKADVLKYEVLEASLLTLAVEDTPDFRACVFILLATKKNGLFFRKHL